MHSHQPPTTAYNSQVLKRRQALEHPLRQRRDLIAVEIPALTHTGRVRRMCACALAASRVLAVPRHRIPHTHTRLMHLHSRPHTQAQHVANISHTYAAHRLRVPPALSVSVCLAEFACMCVHIYVCMHVLYRIASSCTWMHAHASSSRLPSRCSCSQSSAHVHRCSCRWCAG